MLQLNRTLTEVLGQRLKSAGLPAERHFREASEVIVFGSMSVGLDRADSDIDVLCISESEYTLKSKALDLIVLPSSVTESRSWLESELATHVGKYGTWLEGIPRWKDNACVGTHAIDNKRRRVSAFMRALEKGWPRLQEGFRIKYSVKVRRETQRLLLLERRVAIPPTIVLDRSWSSFGLSPQVVCSRIRELAGKPPSDFVNDFLYRVQENLEARRDGKER